MKSIQNLWKLVFSIKFNKVVQNKPYLESFLWDLSNGNEILLLGLSDLRLGTEFILTKKTRFSNLDVKEDELSRNIQKYQEKVTFNIKDSLVLHPNEFILGCTLEYIKLPEDVIGYIIGRSSWGRLGLIIATATLINPGFAGIITLELTNVGEVPINLYPGLRIAQVSLHSSDFVIDKDYSVKSKYFGSTSPFFSKIYEDTDLCLIKD